MKIRSKIYLIFVVYLILLVILGSVLYLTAQKMVSSIEKGEISDRIVHKLFSLNILTNEYFLYGIERTKDQWQTVHISLGEVIKHNLPHDRKVIHIHTEEEENILRELTNDHKLIGEYFSRIIKPEISLELRDRLVSQILLKSQDMVTDAFQLSNIFQKDILHAQSRDNKFNLIILTTMFILVSAGFYILTYSALKPIKKLVVGSEIIGNGDFKHKIEIIRKDEFGDLATAFNKMTTNLETTTASRDELNKEMEERKKTEDELRDSKALLGSVFDSSLSGIMAFKSIRNDHGTIEDFEWLMVNVTAEQMVSRSQEDLIGKRLLEEMPGNRKDGLFDFYVNVVETGIALNHEHYYEHEQVKTWFQTVAVKLNDGFVVTFANITDRKNSEKELINSEHRYRELINNSPVSLWEEDWAEVIAMVEKIKLDGVTDFQTFFNTNPDFVNEALSKVKILDVNKETLSMFKAENKAQMLESLAVVFATDDTLPGFIGKMTALANGDVLYENEMSLCTVQGDILHTFLRMNFPTEDALSGQVLVSIMNITEIKEAQEQIIKEKAITELIIDSIPGVFYQIRTDGSFVKWNKQFEAVTGYNSEEIEQMLATDLFAGEEVEVISKAMQKVFVTGEAFAEAGFVNKSGKSIPYLFTGKLVKIDEKPFLIGMGTDVSDLKKIERDLIKYNDELKLFNKMAVGREKHMIELKRKINSLSKELGNEDLYDLSFTVDEIDEVIEDE